MFQDTHQPVLAEAVLEALAIRRDGIYVDTTYGRGGHTRAVLAHLGENGRLIAFDCDPEAEDSARLLAASDARLRFVRASFTELGERVAALGLAGRIDGLLFDLGVSSPQLDCPERGFSFRHAGPLDMRMNPDAGAPLAAWLAQADRGEIATVIKRYGEEPRAARIAAAIVAARDSNRLTDTAVLAAVIKAAVPARVAAEARVHPATRTFQAFRIHINDELAALDAALAATPALLKPGGRLVAISFHSLEDRIVKRFLRHGAHPPASPLPMVEPPAPTFERIGKPVVAGAKEIARNPRARSAILRVGQRTAAPETRP